MFVNGCVQNFRSLLDEEGALFDYLRYVNLNLLFSLWLFCLKLNILSVEKWRLLRVELAKLAIMNNLSMLQIKQIFVTTYCQRIVPCQIKRLTFHYWR